MRRFAPFAAFAYPLTAGTAFAAEGGEAKAGLPQLDPSLFPAQLFWLAVTFGLLYVLMAFVALPRVKTTQANRRTIIDAELAAARKASEDARQMMAKADKALADARANAVASMNDIKAQANREAAEAEERQSKDLSARLHEAESRITAARTAAMKDVDATARDIARAIVEKLSGAAAGAR